jgi:sugar phosphate isomerase/epimerase
MRLAIQLYTLRDLEEPLTATIERLGDTPFEGVEFAGLGNANPRELAAALSAAGLDVAGAHVGVDELDGEYEAVRDAYGALDCEALVVPSYDPEAFETAAGAREAGRRLSALAGRVAADGFELHYHNHAFEFGGTDDGSGAGEESGAGATGDGSRGDTTGDGSRGDATGDGSAFDAFVDAASGVGIEVDTGLAHHAGIDPVDLIERYGDRVSLVHLTDSRRGTEETSHVDPGEGDVDLRACIDAAERSGAEWAIFEHGLTGEPEASLTRAAERLPPLVES